MTKKMTETISASDEPMAAPAIPNCGAPNFTENQYVVEHHIG